MGHGSHEIFFDSVRTFQLLQKFCVRQSKSRDLHNSSSDPAVTSSEFSRFPIATDLKPNEVLTSLQSQKDRFLDPKLSQQNWRYKVCGGAVLHSCHFVCMKISQKVTDSFGWEGEYAEECLVFL